MRSNSPSRPEEPSWLHLLVALYIFRVPLAWEAYHVRKAERHVAFAEKWRERRKAMKPPA